MTSRTHPVLIVTILLIVCISPVRSQERQRLQYRHESAQHRTVTSARALLQDMTTVKPQGVRLPQFTGRTQFFTQWSTPMAPTGRLHIAVDESTESGRWDLLFIDSDADGHLDDEQPVTAYLTEQYDTHFGPVKVEFEGKDFPIAYHLNFKFFNYNELNRRLYIYSGCWYEGQITVDWLERHCVLIDGNVNGTFSDKTIDTNIGDKISIGSKKDPAVYVGNYIEVGGVLYHPEIARQGGWVKLTKAEDVKFGSVQFPESIIFLMAGGENGLFRFHPEGGTVSLPVGRYRFLYWWIDRKDDQGRRWGLHASAPPNGGFFEVNYEEKTHLSIGEPVLSILEARSTEEGHSFRQSLSGRLGEHIQLEPWLPSRDRPGPPTLRIRNKDGSYDRTLTFEYG